LDIAYLVVVVSVCLEDVIELVVATLKVFSPEMELS